MDFRSLEKQWNDIPEKGILPKEVKARMWENIETATLGKRRRSYRWVVAVSAVVVMCLGGYFATISTFAPAAKMLVTNTYPDDIRLLRLPDGTRVWINQNTQIIYPETFEGDLREVTLKGEAFFEVAQNPEKPFVITTGAIKTTVLGTSFDVRAYSGEALEVRVRSGRVKVEDHANMVLLKKGDAVIAQPNKGKFQKKAVAAVEPEWKKALIDIDGLTLEAVVQKIQDGHDLKVVYANDTLKKLKIKGTLDTRQGIAEMMQTVAFALELTVSTNDGHTFTIDR